MLRIKLAAGIAACLLGASSAVFAQADNYPNRPITFIAPYNPGGSYDTVARLMGEKLSQEFGRAVVIENRPGAGSLIGTEVAAKAAADGHTLVMYGNNHAVLPAVHKTMPFDVQKSFGMVALLGKVPGVLLVNPSLKIKTVAELVALAKSKPGTLNYGSGGNGSSTHLATEMLKVTTGTDITHIPYKAGQAALMDLIAGQTHVGLLDMVSARAHVESGKLIPLAVTAPERSSFLKDVPTIGEAGFPGYEFSEWFGIAVPAGTPAPVIEKLNAALKKIIAQPSVNEKLVSMSITPFVSTPAEFSEFLGNEIRKNKEIGARVGLKID